MGIERVTQEFDGPRFWVGGLGYRSRDYALAAAALDAEQTRAAAEARARGERPTIGELAAAGRAAWEALRAEWGPRC